MSSSSEGDSWILEQTFPVKIAGTSGDDEDGYSLESAACALGDGMLVIAKHMKFLDYSKRVEIPYKSIVDIFEFVDAGYNNNNNKTETTTATTTTCESTTSPSSCCWRFVSSFTTPRSLYFQLTLKIAKSKRNTTSNNNVLVAACDLVAPRIPNCPPGDPKGGDSVLIVTNLLKQKKVKQGADGHDDSTSGAATTASVPATTAGDDTDNVVSTSQLILPPPGIEGRHWFGRRNDMNGKFLIIGDNDDPEGFAHIYESSQLESGIEYNTTTSSSWKFHSTLKAPKGSQVDDIYGFGKCVAIDEQSKTAAIATEASVYIFNHDNESNSWKQETKIEESGFKIAMDGDTLVIGQSAAVHVYFRSSSSSSNNNTSSSACCWVKQACLEPPPEVGEPFDMEVLSLDGDILVVGCCFAAYHDIQYAGAVCIFERTSNDGEWRTQPTILRAPCPTAFGRFGKYVDVRGDRVSVGTEVVEAAGLEYQNVYTFTKRTQPKV